MMGELLRSHDQIPILSTSKSNVNDSNGPPSQQHLSSKIWSKNEQPNDKSNTININMDTQHIEQQYKNAAEVQAVNNHQRSSTQSEIPNNATGSDFVPTSRIHSYSNVLEADVMLARRIPDDSKQGLGISAAEVHHAEFYSRIAWPAFKCYGIECFLFPFEPDSIIQNSRAQLICRTVDNAKIHFICPNASCARAWTSMRGRIEFRVFKVDELKRFIVFKLNGQRCIPCSMYADPIWYFDEICRVYKNLAAPVLEHCLQYSTNNLQSTIATNNYSSANYTYTSRKGTMQSAHVKEYCEACQCGLCFN